jgi:peptidoglycan/xylan/chitin deacetylase (PgdA/CDA1 family)
VSYAQGKVSITIDDVPNSGLYQSDHYHAALLNTIDSLDIPVTIFINEGLIYKTDAIARNFTLLNEWVKNENITLGNHTFSHPRYSEVGLEKFTEDIKKGESITRELARKYHKDLRYFRFPYNDLGKDSLQHSEGINALEAMGYINTPFTVESADWMFNKLYTACLEKKDYDSAKKIGQLYVLKTMEFFHFFDSIAHSDYGRDLNHIYLCHDNKLNADYLASIISELKNEGYQIAPLEDILSDEFYHQKDEYDLKWGISWYYRFISSEKKREELMKSEPDMSRIYRLFENLN